MNFSEHCNLCENIKLNLKDGITCGLTNQKPVFKETCSTIKLGEKFEKKIGLTHIEIESLKKKKTLTYIYFSSLIVIALLIILSQRNFLDDFDFTYGKYIKLSISLFVIILGFKLCSLSYSKLSQYIKKVKMVKDEKDRIDAVLNKYQIEYSCNVVFGEKYHGNQDVIIELKSNSDLLKDSKKTFQI